MKKADLQEIWELLSEIKDNPEIMKAFTGYVKMLIAAQEGRLTPEQTDRLEACNELIHCINQLYCKTQELTPEKAQSLKNRIFELSGLEA